MLTFAYDNTEKIWFNGMAFEGIDRLGFDGSVFVVALFTGAPDAQGRRGHYFTTIPISQIEYRAKYPMCASWSLSKNVITVYDDWYNKNTFKFRNRQHMAFLVEELRSREIPEILKD